MKKIYFIIILTIFSASYVSAQRIFDILKKKKEKVDKRKEKKVKKEFKNKSLKSRFSIGGNMPLGFNPLAAEFSPTLLFNISPKLRIGGGFVSMYNRIKVDNENKDTYVYGGRFQIIPHLTKHIFIQAEYEGLNVNDQSTEDKTCDRIWLHSPLLGAGITFKLIGKTHFTASVSYDFNHKKENSPFASPFRTRIGFNL